MATRRRSYPLLQGFVKSTRLPWFAVAAIAAGILLLFLVLTVYLGGSFSNGVDWRFWRLGLQPAIIVYILVVFPFIQHLWERATQSLRTLLPRPELADGLATYNRRGEWTAMCAGAIFAVAISLPWTRFDEWSDLYGFTTQVIMFALLGFLIYSGFAATTQLARLTRHHIRLDVFDNESLIPVARWSLGTSLAFVGGTSLSVVFQPVENLLNMYSIIVYSILTGVTVILFFLSIWSIHAALDSAKRRELAMARQHLGDARRELKQHITQSVGDSTDRLYASVAVWGLYERQVLEASTWPFNAGIVTRLAASTVAPAVVYIIKVLANLENLF